MEGFCLLNLLFVDAEYDRGFKNWDTFILHNIIIIYLYSDTVLVWRLFLSRAQFRLFTQRTVV